MTGPRLIPSGEQIISTIAYQHMKQSSTKVDMIITSSRVSQQSSDVHQDLAQYGYLTHLSKSSRNSINRQCLSDTISKVWVRTSCTPTTTPDFTCRERRQNQFDMHFLPCFSTGRQEEGLLTALRCILHRVFTACSSQDGDGQTRENKRQKY